MIDWKIDWKKDIQPYDERRNIIIPGNANETVIFAVEQLISIANESISAKGAFTIALSGGSTPKAIFELLSKEPYRNQVDWGKVFLFWSDERSVASDNPESNFYMAMQAGLKSLPILAKNIYRMGAEKDIEASAAHYEELIKSVLPSGEFDLIMLGMGEDGHTASLFPKTDALTSLDRIVVANYVPQKNTWRMTLTYKCINAARNIVIYVIGESKAVMLKHVLTAPYEPEILPIQAVGIPTHKALWIIDKEAAKGL
ncbi:MAG: 6-phosphogluconolactonase [Parachlamydiaceae bacterium]|nr:6-phosphogluconolactonase [Parachlamydiaceae bacterium]